LPAAKDSKRFGCAPMPQEIAQIERLVGIA
jgi:hypothetical protein